MVLIKIEYMKNVTITIICRMRCIMRILLVITLFISFGVFNNSTFAQVYQDDFDVLEKNDWDLWGDRSDWKVKEGFLRTTIQTPFIIENEVLQFKGFPPPYQNFEFFYGDEKIQKHIKKPGHENFTITVQDIGTNNASFGIALGKRFPNFPGPAPFFYLFLTHRIEAVRLTGWGGEASFIFWRAPHHPDIFWNTFELESMVIHFNKGRFQWFANGKKRTDFIDPGFSSIEIIGFVVTGYDIHLVGHAWVDSFKISGRGLSVSPQTKLATTWGTLKQHQ